MTTQRRRRSFFRDYMGPSPQEIEAAKTAERATQDGSTWGGLIGTGIGALGGAALGSLGGPAGAATGLGLGATLGGGVGSAIGGHMGTAKADAAEDTLRKAQLEREEKALAEQLRREAVDRLLATS